MDESTERDLTLSEGTPEENEAAEALVEILMQDPIPAVAMVIYGATERKDWKTIVKVCDEMLEDHRSLADRCFLLEKRAYALYDLKQYEQCVQSCDARIEIASDFDMLTMRMQANAKLGNLEACLSDHKEALRLAMTDRNKLVLLKQVRKKTCRDIANKQLENRAKTKLSLSPQNSSATEADLS